MNRSILLEEHQIELENRIRNLVWTISGDYTQEVRPDTEAFLQAQNAAIYDGVKQGGLARFFDRGAISLYLVKKVYCHAEEAALLAVAQLCIDEAVGTKLDREREGVRYLRKKAYAEILEEDFRQLSSSPLGMFKAAFLREGMEGSYRGTRQIEGWLSEIHRLRESYDTDLVIRTIDSLYNQIVEPSFEKKKKTLEQVLAITLEELTEYSWKDFLSEDLYEETLETYLDQVTEAMTGLNTTDPEPEETQQEQPEDGPGHIVVTTPEALERMYTYVEKNFGKTYLKPAEEKSINYQMCRGIHSQCSLYYTEGILNSPVLRNYQYEYARRQKDKNKLAYYDKHAVVKRNIAVLTGMLRKAFDLRNEEQEIRADHGRIIPAELWKVGRSNDARLFRKTLQNEAMDFVVDVLIDASGSQRKRQTEVVLQAYIISETMSNLGIPFRVMSFCTFWDYTVLHRFRNYEDDRTKNANLFEFMTSSNNRDGLAIRAAGSELLCREESNKVMIILSDGKPNDVLVQKKGARNPAPYQGRPAVLDTGTEVRRLRQNNVAVLGVFVGEETELSAERRIFGKDFAYIRSIENFSNMVGRYLLKQIED